MRYLDNSKRETHSNVTYLQGKIKDLQARVRNQNDIQKHKEE